MFNELDVHGMRVAEAKNVLDHYLDRLPESVNEVTIIHGYHGGTALQHFVRKQYKHARISRSMMSMNPGETILVLKHK